MTAALAALGLSGAALAAPLMTKTLIEPPS